MRPGFRQFCWALVVPFLGAVAQLVAQETSPPAVTPAVTESGSAPSVASPPAAAASADAAAPADQPAAAVAETATPPKAAKPVVIPYDRQVYQVSLTLGFSPESGVSLPESRRLVEQWRKLIESRVGRSWKAEIQLASASEPRSRPMLEAINHSTWNTRMEPTSFDKRFALTIDREGTGYRVSGIEWDRSSQSTTQVQSLRTYDRRMLVNLATELTFRLFRPLVTIEATKESQVELRVRGGDYLPHDPALMPYSVGEYISPFLRHYGKKKELLKVQHVPWTAIRIDAVDRGYVKGSIISAFPSPLTGKRRRLEMLGIKVNRGWPNSTVKVIPRGKPESPMAGYRVEVLNRPETKDDKVEDRLKLRTDRNGNVVVPADAVHQLQYLIVYSGKAPLAKAPLIPGHEPQLLLSAPDDAPRLNVEAETELLQSELIDIVAKREVLMARGRGAAKKGNWDLVTELTTEVKALPTLASFQSRIETLQIPAIQAARRSKDKGQESRIVRMCKQISDMATQHLDPVKVNEFLVEIEEEKKNQ